jgi:hypothetical protein
MATEIHVRGRIDVTDRNGHIIEHHEIDEATDRAALLAQQAVFDAVFARFDRHAVYLFTNWRQSICGGLPKAA